MYAVKAHRTGLCGSTQLFLQSATSADSAPVRHLIELHLFCGSCYQRSHRAVYCSITYRAPPGPCSMLACSQYLANKFACTSIHQSCDHSDHHQYTSATAVGVAASSLQQKLLLQYKQAAPRWSLSQAYTSPTMHGGGPAYSALLGIQHSCTQRTPAGLWTLHECTSMLMYACRSMVRLMQSLLCWTLVIS